MRRTRGAGVPQRPTADFREGSVAPQASHSTTQEGQQAQVPTEADIIVPLGNVQPPAVSGGGPPGVAVPEKAAAAAAPTAAAAAAAATAPAAAAPQGSLPPVAPRANNDDAERRFLRTATRIVLAGTSSAPPQPAPSSSALHGAADPTVVEIEEATQYLASYNADEQLWPPWLRPRCALLLVKLLAVALRRAESAELATRHRAAFYELATEVMFSFAAVDPTLYGPGVLRGQQQLMAKQLMERVAQAMVRSGAFQCLGRLAAASPSLHEYTRGRDALLAATCLSLRRIACLGRHRAAADSTRSTAFPPTELVAALADSHLLEHLARRTLLTDSVNRWELGDKLLRAFTNLSRPSNVMSPLLHSHGLPGPCMQFVHAAAVVALLHMYDGRSMYGLPEDFVVVIGSATLVHTVDVISAWLQLQTLDEDRPPANSIMSPAARYELSMRICTVCTNVASNGEPPPPSRRHGEPPPPSRHEPSPAGDSGVGGSGDAARSADGAGGSSSGSTGKSAYGGGGVLAGEIGPMAAATAATVTSIATSSVSSAQLRDYFSASTASKKSICFQLSFGALITAHRSVPTTAPPTYATAATSTHASTTSSTGAATANTAPGAAATAASTTAAVDTASIAAAGAIHPTEPGGGGSEAAATAAEEEQNCGGRSDAGRSVAAGSLVRPAGWWEGTTRVLGALALLVPELAGADELVSPMGLAGTLVQRFALGQGKLAEELPAHLPAEPPPDVAAALAAGLVPALEHLLRRAIILGPNTVDLSPGYVELCAGVLSWPQMGWLMAYGNPRQVAALVVTLGKVIRALGVESALPYNGDGFNPLVLGMRMVQKGLMWAARAQLPLQQQSCQPQHTAASGTLLTESQNDVEASSGNGGQGTLAGSAGGGVIGVSGSGVSNGSSGVIAARDGGDGGGGGDGRGSNAGSDGCQPARVADPPAGQLLRLLTFAFQAWMPTWILLAQLRVYDAAQKSSTRSSTSRRGGPPPPPPLEPGNLVRDTLRMVGLALDQLDQLAATTEGSLEQSRRRAGVRGGDRPPKALTAAADRIGVTPPPVAAASVAAADSAAAAASTAAVAAAAAATADWVRLLTEQAIPLLLYKAAEVAWLGCMPVAELEPLQRVCYQMLTHCGPAMGADLRGVSAGLKPVQAFNLIFGPKGSKPDKRLMDLLRGARDAGASTSGSPPPPPPSVAAAPPLLPPSRQALMPTVPRLPPLAEVRSLQRTCANTACRNLHGSSEVDLEFRPYDSGGKEISWLCGLAACRQAMEQRSD